MRAPHDEIRDEIDDEIGSLLPSFAGATVAGALGGPAPRRPASLLAGGAGDRLAATFVTIRRRVLRGGKTYAAVLHGCIGTLEPRRALLDDIAHNALGAAFSDPRATHVTLADVPSLTFEVTLLGALEPIAFTDEESAVAALRPGIDGVVLRVGGRRGTFLPQVWESLPERREFLENLKLKAGLPTSFWSADVELHRYATKKWSGAAPPC